jgi:hypothetical protein
LLGIAAFLIQLATLQAMAQDIPLLSGGVGFLTATNGGNTTYIPTIVPVLVAPLGQHVLVESRANLLEAFSPVHGRGYDTTHFVGLSYLQADIFATGHITLVGGYFLTPFGTYNERLTPIWISNFQEGPLILPLGAVGTGSSTGGMVRGNAYGDASVSFDYAGYFSAQSTNEQLASTRTSGGRIEAFLPRIGLELGASFNWILTGKHSANIGANLWLTPPGSPFRLRSEYAHSQNSSGYWIEADYRLSRFGGGEDTPLGRLEPVLRAQQTFRSHADPSDGLPAANTQRVDMGLDYFLPHDTRINTSYSRQFSSTGNVNIWETGIVYRFLFPAWKGKK